MDESASTGAGSNDYIKLPVDKTGERLKDGEDGEGGSVRWVRYGRWVRGGGVYALCDLDVAFLNTLESEEGMGRKLFRRCR